MKALLIHKNQNIKLSSYGSYNALKKTFQLTPEKIIEEIKESGLKGRGGAGFPTGIKWGFLPKDIETRYLVVNADESEPGTCKDVPVMLNNPHLLIEGALISAYAIKAKLVFIYVRGEVPLVQRVLKNAIKEAKANNFVGENILNSNISIDIIVHSGAGAYICGEETALLDSLEGKRGEPRLKPPFPAIEGLYAKPTIINNVETIASVPLIIENGSAWFSSKGTKQSSGIGIYSLSGHIKKPGQYERELGVTLNELLKDAGGIRDGHKLKFWTPGGSSTPIFTEKHLNVPLSYEDVAKSGSLLGTRAIQIFDETTCTVNVMKKWMEFYVHESCGKCTPCREGTSWLLKILTRIENGDGKTDDIELIKHVASEIIGKSFCALGEGAPLGLLKSIEYFSDEYLEHIRQKKCPFDHSLSYVF
jgi:NADH-quinone oxidoreductase subunit F